MRINYSEDEDYPGQFGLWQGNCQRSLSGRKGQESLRELEAALLALPSKRLISGVLEENGDVCAIGALVRHKNIKPEADPEEEMEDIGVECGMPRLVAWKVVEMNDVDLTSKWSVDGNKIIIYTPEERYTEMLKWVQAQLRF